MRARGSPNYPFDLFGEVIIMSKFIKFDEQVLACKVLTSSEKLVISFLLGWNDTHIEGYKKGYQFLADKLGLTKRAITSCILELEKKDLLVVDRFNYQAIIKINYNRLRDFLNFKPKKTSYLQELFDKVYGRLKK